MGQKLDGNLLALSPNILISQRVQKQTDFSLKILPFYSGFIAVFLYL